MLIHGVAWDGPAHAGGSPALRVQLADGSLRKHSLGPGSFLGLRVDQGVWCLGYTKVDGPGQRTHVPCPNRTEAERGRQCGPCFARDDSRLMHDFHRGGNVPQGLRAYLMQPHWLYVATFAGGASKVGTASGVRKWNRLAEQGAVHASYVAHAEDGRIVRVLEDLVTRELGLAQQVRAAAKATALLDPLPGVELSKINRKHAAAVRSLLEGVATGGFSVVHEEWQRPVLADALCCGGVREAPSGEASGGSGFRHPYPTAFDGGCHGLELQALCGSSALARLDGTSGSFVADLAGLKGRRVEFGAYRTEVPALQDALF